MRRSVFVLLLVAVSQLLFADKGESSRILIHTLNYLSQDYSGAVTKDGQIISQSEFHEQDEFAEAAIGYYKDLSPTWGNSDSVIIGAKIYRLDSLVGRHAPVAAVASLAIEIRDDVIKASGIKIVPVTYPNLENGKIVFKTECAKCHGQNGYGDGPEGKGLNPLPKNFHDDSRVRTLSPFFAFNTVRLGVEGTGMKAHLTLSDEEVWDVAFYVLSLLYQSYKNDPRFKEEDIDEMLDSLTVDKIATTSDEEFLEQLKITDSAKGKLALAAIRLYQPKQNTSEFIGTTLKYLNGAMELYNEGKYNEASQLATLAYLEGIEPVEMQLKSNDPQLMAKLEEQLHRLSKIMQEQKPAPEVKDSLEAAVQSVHQAGAMLDKKEYSFLLALLMSVSILLREGLEAFLVIMVILSILKAGNVQKAARWVHAGWLTAIVAGVIIWAISGKVINSQIEHMELMEGGISLVAVGMLLYVGFWLHGKSEINRWKEYVSTLMKTAVDNGSMLGLAGLSFFVVFREVFESVLFLSALNVEAGGKQSNAIVAGVMIAFAIVILLAVVLLKFSTKLPIPKLFKISSFVMGVLAVILAGKGIHSLQETGYSSIHGIPMFRFEWVGVFPTIETCAAQVLVLLVVILIWNQTVSPNKKPVAKI